MKNGTKSKKAIKRGIKHYPVEYLLKVSVEVQQSPDLGGTSVSGSMTLPIRKGAGARLSKYKKEDVAAVFRQLADVIEQSGTDPSLLIALSEKFSSMQSDIKGKAGHGAN